MLYKVGRFLQLGGLILLPIAMAGEISGNHDLKRMLILTAAGGILFAAGWLIQEAGKPR